MEASDLEGVGVGVDASAFSKIAAAVHGLVAFTDPP